MPQALKLNEIKTNINNVIENIKLLESLSNVPAHEFNVEQSEQLQQRTTTLLNDLSQLPCERVPHIQLQRKRRRRRAKQKSKLQRFIIKENAKQAKQSAILSKSFVEPVARSSDSEQTQHLTLKKRHDARNLLETFDLLDRLYRARGGEKNLGDRLARMRTVWQRVLQESESPIGVEAPTNLALQWNKALFGCFSVPKTLQNCKKHNIREFVQRRIVWDSYISYGKRSSCIPSGWVLPPESPTSEWAKYKCE